MTKISSVILLLAVLLTGACAALRPQDQTAQLRQELQRWENFSSDGVVRVTHEGLTLTKLYALSKTREAIRLDVLDGGVFGINPTPLLSVYAGEYVVLQSPFMPQLEDLVRDRLPEKISLAPLSDPDTLVARYGAEIVRTRKLLLDSMEFEFSPAMQLSRIVDGTSGAELRVVYTSQGNPDKLTATIGRGSILELLVDNISYGDATLIPLPPMNQTDPAPEGGAPVLPAEALAGEEAE